MKNLFYSLFCILLIGCSNANQKDLVGVYNISKTTNIDFDTSTYEHYQLELKSDSTFILTQTPYISICNNGRYEIDYEYENNELAFRCDSGITPASIVNELSGFHIEFILGDPDMNSSIIFKKTEN